MTKNTFPDVIESAQEYGWKIPVKISGSAWEAVIRPRPGEIQAERIQLLMTALTRAARGQKRQFIRFLVPATPFRPSDYPMVAGLFGKGTGSRYVEIFLLSEVGAMVKHDRG